MEVIATDPKGSVERATQDAIAAAIEEGIIDSAEQAKVEVLEEGAAGVFGIGRKPATVKVTRKPKRRRRRRRGRKGGGTDEETTTSRDRGGRSNGQKPQNGRSSGKNGNRGRQGGGQPKKEKAPVAEVESEEQDNPEEQAEMVREFLAGLIDSLGLDGNVTTYLEDGIIKADVTGEQTEVLVGQKGSLIRSIQELSRTVLQRKAGRPRRVILDIAGYGARRREALGIYATRLAESVLDEGGEIMLEPMNAADRKVVHDAISEIKHIRSYSEGEEPRRCVVIAAEDGYTPPSSDEEE